MTMVCSVTPIERTARSARLPGISTPAALMAAAAGGLAAKAHGLIRAMADHRRRHLDARALEALPFDLRKDLGWPGGDMHR